MSTNLTKKKETYKWDFEEKGIRCYCISICGSKLGLSAIFYWYLKKWLLNFHLRNLSLAYARINLFSQKKSQSIILRPKYGLISLIRKALTE